MLKEVHLLKCVEIQQGLENFEWMDYDGFLDWTLGLEENMVANETYVTYCEMLRSCRR